MMTPIRVHQVMRIGLAIGFCLLTSSFAAANELVDLARKRQNLAHDLRLDFTVTSDLAKNKMKLQRFDNGDAKLVPVPNGFVQHTFASKLYLKGNLLRYESNEPILDGASGKYNQKPLIIVVRDKDALSFSPDGLGHSGTPVGILQRHEDALHLKSSLMLPLMIYFRGLDKSLNVHPLDTMTPTGATVKIHDRDCKEFEIKMAGDRIAKFYFDIPAAGTLRRMTESKADKVVSRMEINYRDLVDYGPFPQSWEYTKLDQDNHASYSFTASVSNVTKPAKSDSKLFDVEFPTGTFVSDQLAKEEYSVGDQGVKLLHARGAPSTGIRDLIPKYEWFLIIAAALGIMGVAIYSLKSLRTGRIRPA